MTDRSEHLPKKQGSGEDTRAVERSIQELLQTNNSSSIPSSPPFKLQSAESIREGLQDTLRPDTKMEREAGSISGQARVLRMRAVSRFRLETTEEILTEISTLETACAEILKQAGPKNSRVKRYIDNAKEDLNAVRVHIEGNSSSWDTGG